MSSDCTWQYQRGIMATLFFNTVDDGIEIRGRMEEGLDEGDDDEAAPRRLFSSACAGQ